MSSLEDLFSGEEARAEAALAQVTAADVPGLIDHLAEGERDARQWAAAGLGRVPAEAALAALLRAAADPDQAVRAAVLHSLGEQRAPAALTPLLFALADPSPFLARIAGDALIKLGPAAVPALCRALEQEAEPRVRVALTRAIAHLADPRAIPALFRALDDDSALVQHWADEGLERLGVGQVYFQP